MRGTVLLLMNQAVTPVPHQVEQRLGPWVTQRAQVAGGAQGRIERAGCLETLRGPDSIASIAGTGRSRTRVGSAIVTGTPL